MSKKCIAIVTFLILVIAAGVYKFIFQGSVSNSADGRVAIRLDAGETNHVLMEMRMFLESTQQIIRGANEGDMKLVAKAARRVGRAAQGTVPGTLMAKLPIEFKKLGSDTHVKFDQLAMDAIDLEDSSHVLDQLSVLMENCLACHSVYRLDISTK